MSPTEGFVTTEDGVRLFFQKLGSGPNVVIIPNAIHMFESFAHLAAKHTVIFFDLRNRGGSDAVTDRSKLARGIHHDVDDLEAVRQHFGVGRVTVIGHSYQGLALVLYAMKYPAHVGGIVQIGPVPPRPDAEYPPHLTGADATLAEFPAKVAELQQRASGDPTETARRFWELLRVLMVSVPEDADKIQWEPYHSQNERNFMPHWIQNLAPSIQALRLTSDELKEVQCPVLTIHGTRDRQAPYGGGCEWASLLPNARLLSVQHAAHVPWIEAPALVFGAIESFLAGKWPPAAERRGAS